MNKALVTAMVLIVVIFLAGQAMAAADWRKGKKLHRDVCMQCHKSRGAADRLQLNARTKAQWSEFFQSGPTSAHQPVWQKLSTEQLDDLEFYFQKYAKDDKQLLGCG
ncbi:c-type cytochrome [Desulfuromonas thiophila]|uniref:c-type cytochrome n=1 Tax=Desulfuromonas thiophila TaxID=57664 RepID=UPI0024A8E4EA|nr:cytochrome c [Desulfuromonas thiophila]